MIIGSLLGQTEHQEAVAEGVKSSIRGELIKRFTLGAGTSVGAAVVFGAFEVLRNDPHDAFPLLRSWGPWSLFSMMSLFVIYDITKRVLSLVKRGVIATENVAVALQQIGNKDDRQLQEVQTLTAYTSQQSEKHGAMLRDVVTALGAISEKLDRLAGGGNR